MALELALKSCRLAMLAASVGSIWVAVYNNSDMLAAVSPSQPLGWSTVHTSRR